MSDLYVFMEFLTLSSSSDDDELILIEKGIKKGRTKIKNYTEEVMRKMSNETVRLN